MHVQHRWLWVPAFAGTTSPRLKQPPSIDTPLRSRRTYARVLSQTFCPLPSEGAGNAGRLVRPQPRVVVENTRVSHHGHTGNVRHSPRNGFNGFLRALLGDRAFLSPSPVRCASIVTRLNASVEASGPHDFAVRVSTIRQERYPRPPHPALHVRDDRETPLLSRRDGAS